MMIIRTLNKDDTDGIFAVESGCFSSPWDKSVILGTISQSSYRYFGAFDDDILCGYASVTLVADECYVNRIAVLESYRKRGIADELMINIIAFCESVSAMFLSLEVRSRNIAAISLYEKHGLKQEGLRRKFYREPDDDALIMTRHFM
ncbi:MAG: ribosomal protein S18-alanine N-acetyltransferase [Acutalibacteraceae bacterium]